MQTSSEWITQPSPILVTEALLKHWMFQKAFASMPLCLKQQKGVLVCDTALALSLPAAILHFLEVL